MCVCLISSDDCVLAQTFTCLSGNTHGTVHVQVGGAWGGDTELPQFMNFQRILAFKVLWRMGLTRCPTACAEGQEVTHVSHM
jgi:hypothetical protein